MHSYKTREYSERNQMTLEGKLPYKCRLIKMLDLADNRRTTHLNLKLLASSCQMILIEKTTNLRNSNRKNQLRSLSPYPKRLFLNSTMQEGSLSLRIQSRNMLRN
jgi:hypothetical protein